MDQPNASPAAASLQQRWELFEQLCGARVRASDASWARSLQPGELLSVVDDLLMTVRGARIAAGDWQSVEDRAWRETLEERLRQVRAFRRFDEATRGSGTLADAG